MVCDTLAPAVRKLADSAQEEVFGFQRFTTFFGRNLIIMCCSTLAYIFASLIFLTTDKTAQWQTAGWGMTLEQCFHLNILLLSTDRAEFLNYEQIIIHICPRLV
jgi:hypothetical protein